MLTIGSFRLLFARQLGCIPFSIDRAIHVICVSELGWLLADCAVERGWAQESVWISGGSLRPMKPARNWLRKLVLEDER